MTARQQAGTGRVAARVRTPGPAMADPGDLSTRVRQRRRELKLTQQELAARAGVSVPYLAYLENNPARPTEAALRQLAAALETSTEFLLGAGTGRPPGPGVPRPQPTLHVLSPDDCYDLIAGGGIGRVVFDTVDGPVVFPVNYAMNGQVVVLRTGADTELAARLDCPVGFEVDRLDEAMSQGWSVLLTGRAARVRTEEQVRRLEARTGLQPWAGGARDVYVQITPYRISGRRICG
ncbi:MAG TPA: pyridoxamine 5'-phosphate oxidase family protein [Streptosporangiaceae bacterium]|nr:pyridoxamine 5'-phosphate oxidase family protein [Streptosporangiaceae bacterium]